MSSRSRDMIQVDSYDDLASHPRISSRGADVVAELLDEGIESVIYVPGWMADDCDLTPVSGGKTLYVGTVEDYSEKAWQVTQSDGASDYLPKSEAVVFESATDTIDSPQQGLDEFSVGGSR